MREIKFRVWDIAEKCMDDLLSLNDVWVRGIISGEQGDTYKLMQYAGVKDKNGKKIYEGDITEILAEDNKMNRFIVKYGVIQRKMASGWLVGIPSFYFDLIDGNFKAFPIVVNYKGIHDLEIMEVIGNIYENPELLK